MRSIRVVQFTLCAALLCAALGPSVRADEWNKKTMVKFGSAVEISGQVLPPGTYVLELVDLASNRNIVQISNADHTHVFATIETIPTYRRNPPDHTLFRFDERPSDSPPELRAWFYPGDNQGIDFLYSDKDYANPPTPTHTRR